MGDCVKKFIKKYFPILTKKKKLSLNWRDCRIEVPSKDTIVIIINLTFRASLFKIAGVEDDVEYVLGFYNDGWRSTNHPDLAMHCSGVILWSYLPDILLASKDKIDSINRIREASY